MLEAAVASVCSSSDDSSTTAATVEKQSSSCSDVRGSNSSTISTYDFCCVRSHSSADLHALAQCWRIYAYRSCGAVAIMTIDTEARRMLHIWMYEQRRASLATRGLSLCIAVMMFDDNFRSRLSAVSVGSYVAEAIPGEK
jgi:hypothetical protein